MDTSVNKIALGITEDEIALCSHLIHFWQSDEEFERGVRFLEIGMDDDSQYGVLFGHEEANERALEILAGTPVDLPRREARPVERDLRRERLVDHRRRMAGLKTGLYIRRLQRPTFRSAC